VLPVSTYPSDSVTGQYHKARKESPDFFDGLNGADRMGAVAMTLKASKLVGVALSLVIVAAVGGQQGGLNVLVEHIRTIGPGRWLGLMTASLVPDTLMVASLAERLSASRAPNAVVPTASGALSFHAV
jgi:hypothetical protein